MNTTTYRANDDDSIVLAAAIRLVLNIEVADGDCAADGGFEGFYVDGHGGEWREGETWRTWRRKQVCKRWDLIRSAGIPWDQIRLDDPVKSQRTVAETSWFSSPRALGLGL